MFDMSIEDLKAQCVEFGLPVSNKHMENFGNIVNFVNEQTSRNPTPAAASVKPSEKSD